MGQVDAVNIRMQLLNQKMEEEQPKSCNHCIRGALKCAFVAIPIIILCGHTFVADPYLPPSANLAIGLIACGLQLCYLASTCFACYRFEQKEGRLLQYMMATSVVCLALSAIVTAIPPEGDTE